MTLPMNEETKTYIHLTGSQFKRLMKKKYLQTQSGNRWYIIRLEKESVQLYDKDGNPVCASKVRKLLSLMPKRKYTRRKGVNNETNR